MLQPIKKKKIPIPECFFNEVLHDQTLRYWKLAQSWNGANTEVVTVNSAIQTVNNILKDLNPQRPLAHHLEAVKNNIVIHGTKRKMLKVQALTLANDDQNNVVPKIYVL